jgi:hypothetical protein
MPTGKYAQIPSWLRSIGMVGAISGTTLVSIVGSAASDAPPQLFGKSIVVSWSETRLRRVAGEAPFQTQNLSLTEQRGCHFGSEPGTDSCIRAG